LVTFMIVNEGLDEGDNHSTMVFLTTLASITGPMTGAISRGSQGCCLEFSLTLLPYCGGILLMGIIPQFVKWPFQRFAPACRYTLWILGWSGWFLSGIISFGHALS